mgnify:CR=1 FL=1
MGPACASPCAGPGDGGAGGSTSRRALASAASVAGLLKRRAEVPAGATVVCVLTGNGLKDVAAVPVGRPTPVDANPESLSALL